MASGREFQAAGLQAAKLRDPQGEDIWPFQLQFQYYILSLETVTYLYI